MGSPSVPGSPEDSYLEHHGERTVSVRYVRPSRPVLFALRIAQTLYHIAEHAQRSVGRDI